MCKWEVRMARRSITWPAQKAIPSRSMRNGRANQPMRWAVTAGEGMTKTGGEESQTVDVTTAMTSVVYIASEGYYFPTDYSVTAVNGIRRSRLM